MKICCIGANGFIGRHLCRILQEIPDVEVVALARQFNAPFFTQVCPEVDLHCVDFRDTDAVLAIARSADVVVDLVASETPRNFPRLGSQQLFNAVRPHIDLFEGLSTGPGTRVVYISSGGTIYGDVDCERVAETAPASPTSGYSFSKYMTEEALRCSSRGGSLTYTILRLSNPFGPGQVVKNDQGLIPAIMSAVAEDREFQVYGNGSAVRDYVFITDAVKAIARAILSPDAARNQVINVGSGQGASVLEVIRLCEEFLDRKLSLRFRPVESSVISRSVLDIAKAEALLGWRPEISLRSGLKATMRASRLHEPGVAA